MLFVILQNNVLIPICCIFLLENAVKDPRIDCHRPLQKDCEHFQSQLATEEKPCHSPERAQTP